MDYKYQYTHMTNGMEIYYTSDKESLLTRIKELKQGDVISVEKIKDIARDVEEFFELYGDIREKGAYFEIENGNAEDILSQLCEMSREKKKVGRPQKSKDEFVKYYKQWRNGDIKIREMQELLGYKTKDGVYKAINRYEKENGIRK